MVFSRVLVERRDRQLEIQLAFASVGVLQHQFPVGDRHAPRGGVGGVRGQRRGLRDRDRRLRRPVVRRGVRLLRAESRRQQVVPARAVRRSVAVRDPPRAVGRRPQRVSRLAQQEAPETAVHLGRGRAPRPDLVVDRGVAVSRGGIGASLRTRPRTPCSSPRWPVSVASGSVIDSTVPKSCIHGSPSLSSRLLTTPFTLSVDSRTWIDDVALVELRVAAARHRDRPAFVVQAALGPQVQRVRHVVDHAVAERADLAAVVVGVLFGVHVAQLAQVAAPVRVAPAPSASTRRSACWPSSRTSPSTSCRSRRTPSPRRPRSARPPPARRRRRRPSPP